jgi:FkbM family methyltransferase
MREEYRLPGPAQRRILDLGANAGYASLFFSLGCPQARILAVEPDPDNYALLVKNLEAYPLVQCLHGAVWSESTRLYLEKVDQPSDSLIRVDPRPDAPTETTVSAFGVTELMARAGFEWVDVIKMDVEGAEREIFSRGAEEWLNRVGAIYIETHDRFAPGSTQALCHALAGRRFDVELRGENLLITFGLDG